MASQINNFSIKSDVTSNNISSVNQQIPILSGDKLQYIPGNMCFDPVARTIVITDGTNKFYFPAGG